MCIEHCVESVRLLCVHAHLRFIQEGLQALLKGWEGACGVCFAVHLDILVAGATFPEAQAGVGAPDVASDDGVSLGAGTLAVSDTGIPSCWTLHLVPCCASSSAKSWVLPLQTS